MITNGTVVAEAGALRQAPAPLPVPAALRDTMKMAPLSEADFHIAAKGPSARIATLSKPRFPEWGEREVTVEDGQLVLPEDMIRMAMVNRHGAGTPPRLAFLENWGTWRGAFATSVSHDSHNLTIFGCDPADMAAAGNALRAAGGGLAIAQGGEVTHLLPLPIAGLMSDAPLAEVSKGFAEIRAEMDRLVDWQPPYLVFKALFGASLVCNPGPRLSDMGLVDVFEKRRMETCLL